MRGETDHPPTVPSRVSDRLRPLPSVLPAVRAKETSSTITVVEESRGGGPGIGLDRRRPRHTIHHRHRWTNAKVHRYWKMTGVSEGSGIDGTRIVVGHFVRTIKCLLLQIQSLRWQSHQSLPVGPESSGARGIGGDEERTVESARPTSLFEATRPRPPWVPLRGPDPGPRPKPSSRPLMAKVNGEGPEPSLQWRSRSGRDGETDFYVRVGRDEREGTRTEDCKGDI